MTADISGNDPVVTPDALLAGSRVLEFFFRKGRSAVEANAALDIAIATFTDRYFRANDLDIGAAQDKYNAFISAFNKDAQAFEETGSYPAALGDDLRTMDRLDYDVVLLLSCLIAPHRYRMMDLIVEHSTGGETALFVGCGPGLEISLLKDRFAQTYAFDVDLNPLLPQMMDDVHFHQDFFPSPNAPDHFDAIYLIEILEHLEDPFGLLAACAKTLAPEGRLHLTTATNIPQFDHLYNFDADHSRFEAQLDDMGLAVMTNVALPHEYRDIKIAAKNHYYTLVWKAVVNKHKSIS